MEGCVALVSVVVDDVAGVVAVIAVVNPANQQNTYIYTNR